MRINGNELPQGIKIRAEGLTEKAVDDSLHSLGISIIEIIHSAISIGLHFV